MCSQQITERITISVGLSQVLGEIIFGMIPNDQHIDVLLVYMLIIGDHWGYRKTNVYHCVFVDVEIANQCTDK